MHKVHTVEFAGLKGFKNGRLLTEAEKAGYEVLLTLDRGISHQQNPAQHEISILMIRSRSSRVEDLLPAVERILKEFESIGPGQIAVV